MKDYFTRSFVSTTLFLSLFYTFTLSATTDYTPFNSKYEVLSNINPSLQRVLGSIGELTTDNNNNNLINSNNKE